MEQRNNDLMLNMLANPDFELADFALVGLNTSNTSLLDKSVYKGNAKILELFKKSDGSFDEKKFDNVYNKALMNYQDMSTKDKDISWNSLFKYAASNIFADSSEKDYSAPFRIISVSNPTKQSQGIIGWGETGKKKLSDDELAQKSRVLLNPLTAGENLENAQWGKDPHNGFFDYFNDTLVMAQWDNDGKHIDPITGETLYHRKGEYKVGADGSYYYEKLDGRDIYGKKVLNKMNVLTEEGSALNKLDFLDSDDIHKSIGGTIMKNLALVGSMFIPYVGPAVTTLSLIPQLASITGTLGKIVSGSENSFFSELEGFGKSWELQGNVSEESLSSTWNLENFINLIGDTMSLLKLQRFIFEKIPYLFKGKYAGSKEAIEAIKKGEADKIIKELDVKLAGLKKLADIRNLADPKTKEFFELGAFRDNIANLKATALTDSFMKGYNKLGEVLSKGYMTAITVADTYGEAKEAGASDFEASILTLGYGLAEAALLNTAIGEWILPELHADKAFNKQIVRGFVSDLRKKEGDAVKTGFKSVREALKGDKSDKRKYVLNLINTSKDFFKGEFFTYGSKAGTLASQTLAGGLGEGIEEVSEEVLADAAKGFFNLTQWMTDDKTRMNSFGYHWDEKGNRSWSGKDIIDRYGMSFFGGLIGGSLTNLGTSYNYTKLLGNMTSDLAYQHAVAAFRNGQGDELRKYAKTLNLDLDNQISVIPEYDSNGKPVFKVDPSKSQDAQARRMILNTFDFIENALEANNINLTDSQFLDKLTLNEWRFNSLYNSQTANDYVREFNKLSTDLVTEVARLEDLNNRLHDKPSDSALQKENDTTNELIKESKETLKEKKLKLQDLLEGKRSLEFTSRAYFEMTPFLNQHFGVIPITEFAKLKYNKEYKDLTDKEKDDINKAYEKYKENPNTRDNIRYGADLYLKMAMLMRDKLPLMIHDTNSPEYNKAISAIHRILNPTRIAIEENSDFLKSAELHKDLINNIHEALTIFDPSHKTKIDKYVKDHDTRRQKAIDDVKKLLEDLTKALEDIENKRNSELKTLNDGYTKDELDRKNNIKLSEDQIQVLQKAIEDLNSKIASDPTSTDVTKWNLDITKHNADIIKLLQDIDNIKLELTNALDGYNQSVESINNIYNLQKDLKTKDYKDLINNTNSNANKEIIDLEELLNKDALVQMGLNLLTYLQPILDRGYMDTSTKKELLEFVKPISAILDKYYAVIPPEYEYNIKTGKYEMVDEGDPEMGLTSEGEAIYNNIKQIRDKVQSLPESKLEGILNQFSLSTTGRPLKYSDLIGLIYNLINNSQEISQIEVQSNIEDAISNTWTIISMLKASIKGAMTDNIGLLNGNPFGYNAMLNYISEKAGNPINLALISELEAEPILNNLDKMSNELSYMDRIYKINTGNKFNQQETTNTALITSQLQSVKRFIDKGDSNPLKDWDDYNILESTIRSIVDIPLNTDKKELELNKTKIKDAFYDFFNKNKSKLENVDEVSKIIDSLDIFSSKDQLLNPTFNSLDDISFIWDIASSAAMKTSDFYSMVANTDFGGVAPLPSQVEALRIAYASLMNRNIFKTFAKAIKKSVRNKVKNMSESEYKDLYARIHGEDLNDARVNANISILAKEANKKIRAGLLNVIPKFSMMNFIEGIAGSGNKLFFVAC